MMKHEKYGESKDRKIKRPSNYRLCRVFIHFGVTYSEHNYFHLFISCSYSQIPVLYLWLALTLTFLSHSIYSALTSPSYED